MLLWLVLAAVLPNQAVAARPLPLMALSASDLISAVNSLRAAHGLPPYKVNSILMGTAQGQADYMASTGSITHTGPGGASVTQRLLAAGYPLAGDLSLGGFRSENIVGSPGMTPQQAVEAWTGDAPHLNTMLSSDLEEIGAGVAQADGVNYYVIDCARPLGAGELAVYTPGAEAQFSGGEDIIVPVAMSTPDVQGNLYHDVQSGQTLWSIAIAYGVKINDIRQLNHLDPTSTVIQLGVKLLIKRVGTATPVPAATATRKLSTATPLPTAIPFTPTLGLTSTATIIAAQNGIIPTSGAVIAIVVVAVIAAALVAWAGRSRPI